MTLTADDEARLAALYEEIRRLSTQVTWHLVSTLSGLSAGHVKEGICA